MSFQDFINNYQHITYLGIFLFLAIVDFVIFMPEEALLLSVGYVVSAADLNVFLGLLVVFAGVLTGDNVLFWLSKYSHRFTEKLIKKIKPETLEKFKKRLNKNILGTIMIMRLLPGLRNLSAILPGMMNVRWKKYQLADVLIVLTYGSAMYLLGYFFHSQLSALIGSVEKIRHFIFIGFEIALTIILLFYSHKKFFGKRKETD